MSVEEQVEKLELSDSQPQPKTGPEIIKELVEKLFNSETSKECLDVALQLGQTINSMGLGLLQTENILFKLQNGMLNKKSGIIFFFHSYQ
jgi:hypothetical protein